MAVSIFLFKDQGVFPLSTLIANVFSCLVLALIVSKSVDFKWLNDFWTNEVESKISEDTVLDEIQNLGNKLRSNLDIEIAELDATASKFFKSVYNNTPRIIR